MHRRIVSLLPVLACWLLPITSQANDIEPGKEFYNATRVTKPIVADGNLSEWAGVPVLADPKFSVKAGAEGSAAGKGSGTNGVYVLFEKYADGNWTGPDDHTSAVQVAWDADNVYFGFVVTDEYHENATNSAWNGDSVQLMIANADRSAQVALYNYALGGVEGALGAVIVNHEAGPGGTEAVVTRNATSKKTIYEIKLPAAALGLTAPLQVGTKFGLGMAINDGDETTPGQKGWGGLGAHSIVFGKTPSETALVTLSTNFISAESPSINAQPQSQSVTAGSSVTFSVTANGTTPLAYQWRKNGFDIPEATNATLTLNGVQASDTANYTVAVSNAVGSVTSANANLNVTIPNSAPSITLTRTGGTTFTAPASMTLNANASDSDRSISRVEFFYSLASQATTLNLIGEDTISPFSVAWTNVPAGSYILRAKATDNAGASTFSATNAITVSSSGIFISNITRSGSNVMITWSGDTLQTADSAAGPWTDVAGSASPTSVPSSGNRKFYRPRTGGIVSINLVGYVNVSLPPGFSAISNPLLSANNTLTNLFRGVADGTVVSKFSSGTFSSNTYSEFDKVWFPNNPTLSPGEGAFIKNPTPSSFSVTFVGEVIQGSYSNPAPPGLSLRGYPALGQVIESGFTPKPGDKIYKFDTPLTTLPTLPALPQASSLHTFGAAGWDVTPTFEVGRAAFVSVAPTAPGIGTQPQSQTVTTSANVTFNVAATGALPLSYQWRKNGANISGATNAVLTIGNVQTANAGSYDVFVSNSAGSMASAAATLAVNNPPTVSITSPTNGATFSAAGNITINVNASDSDGTITKVEFFEGPNKLGEDTASPYSFVWSVVPAGNYSFTAKATDNSGAATTSASVTVTFTSSSGIGYILIIVPPGFSAISNPLNGVSNNVNALFRGVPFGTQIFKYNSSSAAYQASTFDNDGIWKPDITLALGEGAFIRNPTTSPFTNNFREKFEHRLNLLPIPSRASTCAAVRFRRRAQVSTQLWVSRQRRETKCTNSQIRPRRPTFQTSFNKPPACTHSAPVDGTCPLWPISARLSLFRWLRCRRPLCTTTLEIL